MLRLSAKGLGLAAGLVLLAHGVVLGRESALPPFALAAPALAGPLLHLLAGRVLLAFVPPGDVGSHAWRDVAVTLATSLALGSLIASRLAPGWTLALALVLGLARWSTLPGAMVPRHRPPAEALRALDLALALALAGWGAYLLLAEEALLPWAALFVLAFHALAVARRRRAGGYAVLALGAVLAPHGLTSALLPAVGLGLGASFLVPWLRRADRRAGVLAVIGFGALFGAGPSPLAFAGPAVLLAFSHAAQRRFAALGLALSALFFLAAGRLAGEAAPARGRLLWLPELASSALETGVWGLAWPAVLGALLLGALAFEWRAPEWTPGTIETPRREARALAALLVLACAALAPPFSPWAEEEVLVIVFPPCALLAGLLLTPPERAPVPA